jgi:hypothetical protein
MRLQDVCRGFQQNPPVLLPATQAQFAGIPGVLRTMYTMPINQDTSSTDIASKTTGCAPQPCPMLSQCPAAPSACSHPLSQPLTPLLTRLLAGCTSHEVWHLLALLQPLPLAPGHTLCWQGDEAQHLWLLQVRLSQEGVARSL